MATQKSQGAVGPVKIYLDEDVHGFIAQALRHYQALARGAHHAGILLGRQLAGRHNLGPLFNVLAQHRAEDLRDQLVYLSNWSQ